MRDIIFTLVFFAVLPACYRRPFIGVCVFSWLGYMRAQDLTWGFARKQRWSFVVSAAMIAGWLKHPRERWFDQVGRSWIMILMCFTILIGLLLVPGDVEKVTWNKYSQFVKVIIVSLMTMSVVNHREHLRILIWVIALSFGFFGVKVGLAGVLSGGSLRVLQGPGGMLEDNNDFSLALCMALPLLIAIGASERRPIFRRWMKAIVPLTGLAVILTYSRGGFLTLMGVIGVQIWRSRYRGRAILAAPFLLVLGYVLAPAEWKERISTITEYEEDGSAQGRLVAWATGTRMALANPWFGVGYEQFQDNYQKFAGPGEATRVAHNSYIQVWAECGTVTLVLYLLLILLSFLDIWRIRRRAKQRYYTSWIIDYANMFESSLVAFMIGSTFLNRAHFDLFYHYVALIVCFTRIAREEMARQVAYPSRRSTLREQLMPVRTSAFERPRESGLAARVGFRTGTS